MHSYVRLAKEILSYRIAVRDAAAYNAHLFGYQGWRLKVFELLIKISSLMAYSDFHGKVLELVLM